MAERPALELSVGGDPLRIEWDADALGELSAAERGPWRLEGSLGEARAEALRVLSARFEDGSLLLVAALRPAGAAGHGEESIAARFGRGGKPPETAGALLSAEYGADGLPARIGVEIERDDDEVPVRVAGDATASARGELDAGRREAAALEMRLDGVAGSGLYEVLRT